MSRNSSPTGRMTDSQSRRTILKWAGAGGLAVFAFGKLPGFGMTEAMAAELGGGDIGVLNYALALEQLEAAFYTRVLERPYSGMNSYESGVLADIRDHEVEHQNFLNNALGSQAIPALEVDFSAVDFSSRSSVLKTANTFENLGVAAYNGAGQLLREPKYLMAAGSIVSVEARHAAIIGDMLDPLDEGFLGPTDSNGLDDAKLPKTVLGAAKPFIRTPITANGLG